MAIAQAYLKGMEFSGSQYVVYRHTDRDHDHIHVIACRGRLTDGTAVRDSWQYRRSEVLVGQLEQEFGLQPTPSSWKRQERSRQGRVPSAAPKNTCWRLLSERWLYLAPIALIHGLPKREVES